MASPDRKTSDRLIGEIGRNPYAFDFFRAVRLLENARRDLPRIGHSLTPAQDSVRFRQNPSLEFAPSTLEAARSLPDREYSELFVRFFGLLGPNAPLPPHLTEYARERILHHDDRTLAAFLDVFHHRLVSFFYRAWAENQKAVDLDRPEDARYALFIGSFFGLGTEALQHGDAVPDAAKLYFAGRLAPSARNAEGLGQILGDYFGIPTEIQTFVGQYLDLPADSLCRLGASPDTGRLGVNAIAGSRVYDCQLHFRIRLGPMSLADYQRLLPGGEAFGRLKYWVLNYCGEQYFWDVQLVLRAADVPPTRCGGGARLGWTTWLGDRPHARDADDLIVSPSS